MLTYGRLDLNAKHSQATHFALTEDANAVCAMPCLVHTPRVQEHADLMTAWADWVPRGPVSARVRHGSGQPIRACDDWDDRRRRLDPVPTN